MIIQVKLIADADRLVVSAPQANFRDENKALMVTYIDRWTNINPLDIAAFMPELAVRLLRDYTAVIQIHMKRFWLAADFIDQFDYELEISGYETLPLPTQQEFEYLARNLSLSRIRRLTINGQDTGKAINNKLADWTIYGLCLSWALILLALSLAVLHISYPDWWQQSLVSVEGYIIVGGFLLTGLGIIYVGFFLGALSAILILRGFISGPLLRRILVNARLGLSNAVLNWMMNRFI